ncbi:hypothetical protein LMOh7858_2111 [Listeria monocytogenes serotype 4b str. H7858]|nr:hypothetical protein LMOh7858_2111 [Listeria monocytogenes serotype 4b str. H7858]
MRFKKLFGMIWSVSILSFISATVFPMCTLISSTDNRLLSNIDKVPVNCRSSSHCW